MARGGFRVGSGRPKGAKTKSKKNTDAARDIKEAAAFKNMTPLEYMLQIMRDPTEDADRRARMAIAACPFVHARATELGKKEQKAIDAKLASHGKFKPGRPPLTRVK